MGAHRDLGAVAIGQQGVSHRAGGVQGGIGAGRGRGEIDTGEDAVGDRSEQFLLALEMPIQGARLHAELCGEASHREVGQADAIEEVQRDIDDAVTVMSGRAHDSSIVNAVQVNTVQVALNSPEIPRGVHMTDSIRPLGADLARIAVFAALIIVLGMVTIPLPGGVPITGQTLGVMLAGLVLGARRAPLAVLTVLALAAVGLPVLAGGRGGLGVFVGPTAGYLLGWVAGTIVIGLIAYRGRFTWWRAAIAAVVGGIGVVYLFGIPVLAAVTGMPLGAAALSNVVFLPGDLLKAAAAVVLVVALRRAYPRAFAEREVARTAPARPAETAHAS